MNLVGSSPGVVAPASPEGGMNLVGSSPGVVAPAAPEGGMNLVGSSPIVATSGPTTLVISVSDSSVGIGAGVSTPAATWRRETSVRPQAEHRPRSDGTTALQYGQVIELSVTAQMQTAEALRLCVQPNQRTSPKSLNGLNAASRGFVHRTHEPASGSGACLRARVIAAFRSAPRRRSVRQFLRGAGRCQSPRSRARDRC